MFNKYEILHINAKTGEYNEVMKHNKYDNGHLLTMVLYNTPPECP